MSEDTRTGNASNATQFKSDFEKMENGAIVQAMAALANFDAGKKAPMRNFFSNENFNVFVNF